MFLCALFGRWMGLAQLIKVSHEGNSPSKGICIIQIFIHSTLTLPPTKALYKYPRAHQKLWAGLQLIERVLRKVLRLRLPGISNILDSPFVAPSVFLLTFYFEHPISSKRILAIYRVSLKCCCRACGYFSAVLPIVSVTKVLLEVP